jgi:hypothetical protein
MVKGGLSQIDMVVSEPIRYSITIFLLVFVSRYANIEHSIYVIANSNLHLRK